MYLAQARRSAAARLRIGRYRCSIGVPILLLRLFRHLLRMKSGVAIGRGIRRSNLVLLQADPVESRTSAYRPGLLEKRYILVSISGGS